MINFSETIMFIIYVRDQEKSKTFYEQLFDLTPILDVPGMTEFKLSDKVIFGIMPEAGIMRILDNTIPNPAHANGIPRCEIYLYVDNPDDYYDRLIACVGYGISKTEYRNWGDDVAYGLDLDGNVLAFAKKVK